VVLLVLAGGGFWWWRRSQPPPPPAPAVAPAPAPQAAAPGGPPPAAAPAGITDRDRSLLEAISSSADYRAWLAKGDVINRWALVTDNLAEGVSPRRALEFLAPAKPFAVVRRGGATVISPDAYKRYDAFADAVASVDPAAFASAYRTLHPVLEAAWRALGYPDGSLDKVAARALDRLARSPILDREVEVVPAGPLVYLFADPKLEALGAVEKHLLRMGPRNARLVHDKALALTRALGFPAAGR
jgi:hypothetical protein